MIAKVAGVLPKVTLSNPSRSVSPVLIDVRALNRFNRSADCRPTSSALVALFRKPMAQAAGGGAAAPPQLNGLQLCDISHITFDSATEPKEGGFGNAMRAAPRKVVTHERS